MANEESGCFLLGGGAGLVSALAVRGFFFNETDEWIWGGFWRHLVQPGPINGTIVSNFFLSATFAKLAAGFIIGGIAVLFMLAVVFAVLTRLAESKD